MDAERDGDPAGPAAAAAARERLVRGIERGGALRDPRWRAAFAAVPREAFVPVFHDSVLGGYDRLAGDDPDPLRRAVWLQGVYRDAPLALRVDDEGRLVSSSSQPSLMARMLEALDVTDGCRVLEVGTGSGYNAALLAHRLGDAAVTTVDLEEEITAAARERLAAAGYRPTVVTGDGALGCPSRAPFDRILATCSLGAVPTAWPRQCTAGAVILAPLGTGLLKLRVAPDGRAEGRFLPLPVFFVPLRTPGPAAGADGAYEADAVGQGLPRQALGDDRFRFLLGIGAAGLLPQEAYALWRRERRPPRERYGVTVAGDRQWFWLDDPSGPYAWELGGYPNGA
ncbi:MULTISPECIES: methyltransferase domain-containing protein [Streptomyces]|uniref:Protein-L-isoaspartate O-methyltransferase n=1 Tax=Streptomyces ramulosus TaxID=47762 RepID=A0ABW1FQ70_9ACTN